MSEGVADYAANGERSQPGLLNILWDELKPYPGRGRATLRIAIACTAIVLVSNIFRLPYQDLLPFLILFLAKEEKITTAITAVLAMLGITIAVVAAIIIFKCTGNRPEFRIPGMALEIFVGMYLFRILSIGPVGWIMAFIISVAQSVVDLYPTSEEAVHWMLWVWVAVSLAVLVAWVSTFTLFPVAASRVLQREFVTGWETVSTAAKQLSDGLPATGRRLLRPLARQGPIRLLKQLKLSLLESHGLRPKQTELTRLFLTFDKIVKLTLSYSGKLLKSADPAPISAVDKAILGRITANTEYFKREFADGFVPCGLSIDGNERERARTSANNCATGETSGRALQLVEAENTLQDLEHPEAEQPESAAGRKPSLFVADAFSNPRHVQFALKVTLAGMIGYIFYTASDYFGIHTVYYTPLIIALASSGATIHKGVLRIAGCIVGGAIGLFSMIWVIPRFETLGMYLFIVFSVHGLAAWVAFGSERISYMGLQIAIAFDLGVLRDYGPPREIDPIRDRFIGIVLGIIIISAVFSLVWPESARSLAREKLAACLRAIARLFHLGGSNGSQSQREKLELEIGSRLSEANLYAEQATFEMLVYCSRKNEELSLGKATEAIQEIYVASLPWIREQAKSKALANRRDEGPAPELIESLAAALEADAGVIDPSARSHSDQVPSFTDYLTEAEELSRSQNYRSENFEELVEAIRELQQAVISKHVG